MATYYIRGDGNDTTGNGLTPATAWLTISKAVSSSASGDTIICVGGFGNLSFANQTFSSARILQGQDSAILDGASTARQWNVQGNLTINDIKFQNIHSAFKGLIAIYAVGVSLSVTRCIFTSFVADTNGTYDGIFGTSTLSNTPVNFSIVSCLFYDCTKPSGAAPSAAYFHTQYGAGAFVLHNNTFYSNTAATNTLEFMEGDGGFSPNTLELKNNIIWNANGTNKTFDNYAACTYSGSNNDILGWTTNVPALTNQIAVDPLFVDAAGGNFNLRPTSPAIGVGVVI